MRRTPVLWSATAAVALLLASAPARANGRFPTSVSVSFRPGSTQDIYLGVTYGFLISHDDGASFRWLCEQNVGYEGTFDPKYRVAADGTIYATTFEGLRVSRDGGCSFETATAGAPTSDPGRIAGIWIDAIDTGPDGSVWVGTAEAGRPNEVFRSTDGARTFQPVGLTSTVTWWKSIAVAPSRAQRAYVTGYQVTQTAPDGGVISPTVHVEKTDDAGQSWTSLPIGDFLLGTSPLVLVEEVAPDDPDLVFVRSVRAVPPAGDKLYRSTDGGATWAEVLETTDTIRNVVMRADGTVLVATAMGGVHRSTDRGASFEPLAISPQAACLGDRGDALFACGANWEPDLFSLGRSADAATWSKVFRFVEMKGPLDCPVGTVQRDVCEAQLWPSVREQFGVPEEPRPDGDPAPREPGGCCDARGGATGAGAIALGAAVVVAVRRRRRRCCGEPDPG